MEPAADGGRGKMALGMLLDEVLKVAQDTARRALVRACEKRQKIPANN